MFVPTRFQPDQDDPFKEPAWRWRRAEYLFEHGRLPLPLDDALTREAWLFRRALEGCRTDADRDQLAGFPALAEAHAVYSGEPLRRAELEARLLAGGDGGTIAQTMGLSPSCVAAYHDLYFEVRPHLNAPGYILGVVLGGGRIFYAPNPADQVLLLKLFGYGLGGLGVDAFLDYLRDPPTIPARLDDLDLPTLRRLCRRLRTKVLVLLLTTPAASVRPGTWQWLGEKFAARRERQGGGEEAVLASVHGLFDVATGLSRSGRPNDAVVA
jgi:hypothetical protein